MDKDKPDEPDKVEATLRVGATAAAGGNASVRVRLIQPSPDTDPKLLKKARQVARELKEKRKTASYAKKSPDTDPKVLKKAQKLARELKEKRKTASYAKKSLSLFPVK